MKKILLFSSFLCVLIIANAQNNCLDFDGINDFVSVSDDNSIDFGTSTDFTIEAWIKFSSSDNYDGIISKASSGGGSIWTGYQFVIYDNKLALELNNGVAGNLLGPLASQGGLIGTTNLNDGIWHHVAVAVSRTLNNVKFYVDGVEDASINNSKIGTNNLDNSANLHIGAERETSIFYTGNFDEIKIWNDVRTIAEIRANMFKELAGTESNLVAYLKLNETSGINADDSQLGSNNDGILTNMDGNTDWITSSAFAGPKNCLDFDGIDDYVDIGTGPTNIRTVEFWINPNTTTEYFIDLNGSTYISSNSGIISATGFTSPNIYVDGILSNSILLGKWQHIAITSATNINASDFDIGRLEGQEELEGKIDELRLWNNVRTSKEIRENMCKTLVGDESGLLAYYIFDNASGNTLQDFSSNNNDGNLMNMTTSGAGNDWVNSTAFNTWLNTNSTNFSINTNWSRGLSPTLTDNVGIVNYAGGSKPAISSNITVNHIVVESGDTLKLGSNISQTLTNNGNFFNYGTVIDTGSIINNGYIELNGNIYCYNFTNNSGNTIKINSGSTLNISGALTNDGLYNDQGTTRFYGTASQNIPSLTFNNLTIDNMGGVSLTANSIVNSVLNLTLGNLNLNGHNIDLGTTGSLIEAGGRIIGENGYIQATRTLNNPSADNVAGLGFEITSSQNLGSTVIKRGHTVQNGNGNKGIKRYFEVNPTTNNSLNASIKFYYYDNELNGCNEVDLGLFKSTDGGSIWNNMGGIVNTSGNYVSLSGIDSFSIWTGGSSITPLTVVTLNSFDDICIDAAAFTLTGGYPLGGTYSGAGVSGGIFDPAVAGAGTHSITYSYTDGNNNTNTAMQNITVNPLPVPSFSGLASTYCLNSVPATLTGTPASGGGGAIINCSSNCSMPTNYCPSTFSNTTDEWITQVTLNGDTNSSASSTYSDFTSTLFSTVKKDSTYSMSVTSFVAGYYSEVVSAYFDWNRNGTFDANEEILFGSQIGSNTYPQTFTVPSNAVLGETKMRVILRYYLAPTACYSGVYGETEDYKINIIDVVKDGVGAFSGSGISGNTFDPAVAGIGNHTITYSYTDGNSCTNFTTQNTFVNTPPTVTLNTFADVCENAPAFTLTGGSPAGGTYSGIGVNGGNFNPATAGAGTHIITYKYTDGNNCTDSANQNIVVNPLPIVTLNSFIEYCVNATPFTLSGGSPTGGSYSGTGVSGGVFNPASAGVGVHAITYTYTDVNSCTNSAIQYIVVNALPVVSFSGLSPTYCLNSPPALLTGTPASGGGGALIYCSNNCSMPTTYCSSYFSNTTDEWIVEVTLNGDTNLSASTNYSDYTSTLFTTLKKDSTYSMSVTSFVADNYSEVVSAYFDWNRNGTFDTGEEVYFGSQLGTNTYYQTFTVPSNAVLGETKMRVILRYNLAPTPCYTGIYGETEDYRISIIDVVKDGVGVFSGNGISGDIFNPAVAGTGTHTITYHFTNSNGCSDSATQNTSVVALPVVTLNSFADVCVNAPAFTLSGGNPAGGTYSGAGVSGGIFDPTIAGAGNHIITYSYTDGNNCTDSASQNIVVNSLPIVSLNPISDVCVDAPTFTLSGGSPAGGTYSGTSVSGGNFNPAAAGVGTHIITYSYTDGNSCTNSANQNIVVNALPIVTLNPFNDVCVDAPDFTLTGGNPTGGTYSGTAVSSGDFSPATAGVGTHIITYSYTDANSCVNSTTQNIVVNALPTVTLNSFSDVCVDALPFSLSGGSPAGGIYSGTGVVGGDFNPSIAGVGTHLITYSYTDGNSCTNFATQNITVNALPVVSYSGLASDYCVSDPQATLVPNPIGGTFIGSGISGMNFNPSVAGVGTHTITYTYTDANTCTNSYSQIVNVNPNYFFQQSMILCENDSVFFGGNYIKSGGTYYDSLTTIYGCDSIYELQLNNSPIYHFIQQSTICAGDSLLWQGNYYSSADTFYVNYNSMFGCDSISELHLFVNPTYYYVQQDTICAGDSLLWHGNYYSTTNIYYANYNSINGCDSIYELQLFVNPTYYFVEQDTICSGDSILWQGNYYSSADTFYVNYFSKDGCDSIYELQLFLNNSYYFIEQDTICSNDSLFWQGNYYSTTDTFIIFYYSINGCDSIFELQLTVNPAYINIPVLTSICEDDSILLGGAYQNKTGTYYDNYFTTEGCDSIIETTLSINPLPIVTVSVYPDSIEKGKCAELNATGGINYSWTPVSWLDNPFIATPITCTRNTMTYYVEVTDNNGCSNIDSINVIVYLLDDLILYIPNTFTPNGDGKNDKWVIKYIEKFPGNTVTIYNRWGNQVFSATNYKNDWDGNNLPVGAYFYIIDLNRGKAPLKGDINILR